MTTKRVRSTRILAQRLSEAEATIQALLSGQIDAVVDSTSKTPVLLAKAQEALRESESAFHTLAEGVPQIVWMCTPDGMSIYFNHRWVEYTGLTLEESYGRGWNIPFHPDDKQPAWDAWNQAVETGGTYSIECRLRRADGTYRWFLTRGAPVSDATGSIVKWFGTCTDIDDLKRAETDLRLTQFSVEHASDAIFWVNLEGRLTEVNESACHAFGHARRELLTLSIWDIGLRFSKETWRTFWQEIKSRGSMTLETQKEARQGSVSQVVIAANYVNFDGKEYCVAFVRDITERKQREERLREYEKAMEGLDEMIVVVDREFRYVIANRAYLNFRRLTADQLLGQLVPDVSDEGVFNEVVKERMEDCFQGEIVKYEVKYTYPEIGEREMYISYFPIEGPAGIDRIACVLQDITERKRVDAQITRLAAIVSSTEDAIFSTTLGGFIATWNHGAEHMFGYTPEEIKGKHFSILLPEDGHGDAALVKQKLDRGDSVVHYEHEHVRKDGSRLDVSLTLSPIKDDKGLATGVSCIARDITERKRIEAERTRLMTAIEQAAEGVVVTDPQGEIQYVNPAFSAMTGYGRDEALGQNTRILKSGKQDGDFFASMWATLLAGKAWRGEMINRRKDGSLYTEKMSITPVHNGDGKITHMVGMKEDITARKLLEDQFRQAQKMEAVGRLAAGVAHDFNNLLTIITGYSELMLSQFGTDDPLRSYTSEIMGAGERAAGLTRQLLAFSRQQVLAPQVLDLSALVANLTRMLKRLIGEDIDLVFNAGPFPARIKADPGHIEQVLMNLTVNARDAMPRGGKLTIETSSVQVSEAFRSIHYSVPIGSYIALAVSDTGCGMDKDTQAHIFEPFFTTKEQGKGTGLGLATVYGIVQQSGGHIYVYSEVGAGTTFKIYLPSVTGAPEAARKRVVPTGGLETILLVEDDASLRKLARLALESRGGYRVLEASDGERARLFAGEQKGPIHLLLTDVVMPGMNGRELSEALAGLHPDMKILFMSGYTDDTVVRHGVLEKGMAFLQKPFTPDSLLRKVRDVLDTRPDAIRSAESATQE